MPSRETLRIGLIGCGRIAQRVHLRVLSRMPGVEVAALADTAEPSLADASTLAPAAATFADYHQLLASPAVQAAVICLPSGLHAEAAVAALRAGKHVYLEKPIATTQAEAEAVLAAWRDSGKVGQIGFNYRFHPAYVEARRRLRAGAVGRVVAVRSVFSAAVRELPLWKRVRTSGGGALLDLASHHADILRFLLEAEIHDVWASVRSVRSEADTASLEMRFADGVLAQTLVSLSAVEHDSLQILGERGSLSVHRTDGRVEWHPPRRGGSWPQRIREAASGMIGSLGRARRALFPAFDPSYQLALQHFVECCATGAAPRATLEDAARSLSVMLAAEESAQTQRKVLVEGAPPLCDPAPTATAAAGFEMNPIRAAMDDPARPAISVILVTVDRFANLRPVVNSLRRQTVRHRLELVVVGPDERAFDDLSSRDTQGFLRVRNVVIGPITNIDQACARGVAAAEAPVVALMEDHAFPEPDWAEAILAAHREPWAAVGSTIVNANPATVCSWANHLLSYAEWSDPARRGPTRSVSRHNVTFKRDALLSYGGEELASKLGRDGGLLPDLLSRGYEFFLEPRARIHHLNPSRWTSTIQLRVGAGRLFGGSRAARGKWGIPRRGLYVLGAPLIPAVRFVRLRRDLFVRGRKIVPQPKATVGLIVGVVLDGIGQLIGYARGPGATGQMLGGFEMHRRRHLVRKDLPLLAGKRDGSADADPAPPDPGPAATTAAGPEGNMT